MAMALALFVGCKDFLVETPQQALNLPDVLNNPGGVTSLVTGLYNGMHSASIAGGNYNVLVEIMADNTLWTGSFVTYADFANRRMTPDNANTVNWWTDSYRTINIANILLEAVNQLNDPTVTTAQKDIWRGEAYFIRGMLYFHLAIVYSKPWNFTPSNTHLSVPIRTKPVKSSADFENLPRNTLAEVIAQVESDLNQAVNLLPVTRLRTDRRATQYAAIGYLMRVAMYKLDYTAAANYASQLIAAGFTLPSAPALAFNANKFSSESIFEIAWTVTDNPGPNAGQQAFYAPAANGGRGDIKISSSFVTAIGQIITPSQQAAVTAAGGTATDRRVSTLLNGTTANSSATLKFTLSTRDNNVINMRYPEVLLTRAEALTELAANLAAVPAEVYTLLNTVRNRAILVSGGTATQSMIQYTSADFADKQALLDAILLERRVELAFEGDRFYTLHRKGLSINGLLPSDNRITFPIPQQEMDANKNMVQNPGY